MGSFLPPLHVARICSMYVPAFTSVFSPQRCDTLLLVFGEQGCPSQLHQEQKSVTLCLEEAFNVLQLYSKYVPEHFACRANHVLNAAEKLPYTKETSALSLLHGMSTHLPHLGNNQETKGSFAVIGSNVH